MSESPSSPEPAENNDQKIFQQIKVFVQDLWEVFKTKKTTPFALYWRLIDKINVDEPVQYAKILSGFKPFLIQFEKEILEDRLSDIPSGTTIGFGTSKKIFIPIANFIHRADEEIQEAISQHLLALSAIFDPSEDKLAICQARMSEQGGLENFGIDTNTREGQFIESILEKTQNTMQNINTDNPMQAMMGLMQSGVINDMMSEFKTGNMNAKKLLGTMHGALGQIMESGVLDKEAEELDDGSDEEVEIDE